jgi:hypothetical protein
MTSVSRLLIVERADGLVAVGHLDVPNGSLHDQATEFSGESFQTSLELVGAGRRDL